MSRRNNFPSLSGINSSQAWRRDTSGGTSGSPRAGTSLDQVFSTAVQWTCSSCGTGRNTGRACRNCATPMTGGALPDNVGPTTTSNPRNDTSAGAFSNDSSILLHDTSPTQSRSRRSRRSRASRASVEFAQMGADNDESSMLGRRSSRARGALARAVRTGRVPPPLEGDASDSPVTVHEAGSPYMRESRARSAARRRARGAVDRRGSVGAAATRSASQDRRPRSGREGKRQSPRRSRNPGVGVTFVGDGEDSDDDPQSDGGVYEFGGKSPGSSGFVEIGGGEDIFGEGSGSSDYEFGFQDIASTERSQHRRGRSSRSARASRQGSGGAFRPRKDSVLQLGAQGGAKKEALLNVTPSELNPLTPNFVADVQDSADLTAMIDEFMLDADADTGTSGAERSRSRRRSTHRRRSRRRRGHDSFSVRPAGADDSGNESVSVAGPFPPEPSPRGRFNRVDSLGNDELTSGGAMVLPTPTHRHNRLNSIEALKPDSTFQFSPMSPRRKQHAADSAKPVSATKTADPQPEEPSDRVLSRLRRELSSETVTGGGDSVDLASILPTASPPKALPPLSAVTTSDSGAEGAASGDAQRSEPVASQDAADARASATLHRRGSTELLAVTHANTQSAFAGAGRSEVQGADAAHDQVPRVMPGLVASPSVPSRPPLVDTARATREEAMRRRRASQDLLEPLDSADDVEAMMSPLDVSVDESSQVREGLAMGSVGQGTLTGADSGDGSQSGGGAGGSRPAVVVHMQPSTPVVQSRQVGDSSSSSSSSNDNNKNNTAGDVDAVFADHTPLSADSQQPTPSPLTGGSPVAPNTESLVRRAEQALLPTASPSTDASSHPPAPTPSVDDPSVDDSASYTETAVKPLEAVTTQAMEAARAAEQPGAVMPVPAVSSEPAPAPTQDVSAAVERAQSAAESRLNEMVAARAGAEDDMMRRVLHRKSTLALQAVDDEISSGNESSEGSASEQNASARRPVRVSGFRIPKGLGIPPAGDSETKSQPTIPESVMRGGVGSRKIRKMTESLTRPPLPRPPRMRWKWAIGHVRQEVSKRRPQKVDMETVQNVVAIQGKVMKAQKDADQSTATVTSELKRQQTAADVMLAPLATSPREARRRKRSRQATDRRRKVLARFRGAGEAVIERRRRMLAFWRVAQNYGREHGRMLHAMRREVEMSAQQAQRDQWRASVSGGVALERARERDNAAQAELKMQDAARTQAEKARRKSLNSLLHERGINAAGGDAQDGAGGGTGGDAECEACACIPGKPAAVYCFSCRMMLCHEDNEILHFTKKLRAQHRRIPADLYEKDTAVADTENNGEAVAVTVIHKPVPAEREERGPLPPRPAGRPPKPFGIVLPSAGNVRHETVAKECPCVHGGECTVILGQHPKLATMYRTVQSNRRCIWILFVLVILLWLLIGLAMAGVALWPGSDGGTTVVNQVSGGGGSTVNSGALNLTAGSILPQHLANGSISWYHLSDGIVADGGGVTINGASGDGLQLRIHPRGGVAVTDETGSVHTFAAPSAYHVMAAQRSGGFVSDSLADAGPRSHRRSVSGMQVPSHGPATAARGHTGSADSGVRHRLKARTTASPAALPFVPLAIDLNDPTQGALSVKLRPNDSGLNVSAAGLFIALNSSSGLVTGPDGLSVRAGDGLWTDPSTGQLALRLASSDSGLQLSDSVLSLVSPSADSPVVMAPGGGLTLKPGSINSTFLSGLLFDESSWTQRARTVVNVHDGNLTIGGANWTLGGQSVQWTPDGPWDVTVSGPASLRSDRTLALAGTQGVSMSSGQGIVNVSAGGDLALSSGENVTMSGDQGVSVSSAQGDVDISAGGDMGVAAQGDVSVAAAQGSLSLSAARDPNVTTGVFPPDSGLLAVSGDYMTVDARVMHVPWLVDLQPFGTKDPAYQSTAVHTLNTPASQTLAARFGDNPHAPFVYYNHSRAEVGADGVESTGRLSSQTAVADALLTAPTVALTYVIDMENPDLRATVRLVGWVGGSVRVLVANCDARYAGTQIRLENMLFGSEDEVLVSAHTCSGYGAADLVSARLQPGGSMELYCSGFGQEGNQTNPMDVYDRTYVDVGFLNTSHPYNESASGPITCGNLTQYQTVVNQCNASDPKQAACASDALCCCLLSQVAEPVPVADCSLLNYTSTPSSGAYLFQFIDTNNANVTWLNGTNNLFSQPGGNATGNYLWRGSLNGVYWSPHFVESEQLTCTAGCIPQAFQPSPTAAASQSPLRYATDSDAYCADADAGTQVVCTADALPNAVTDLRLRRVSGSIYPISHPNGCGEVTLNAVEGVVDLLMGQASFAVEVLCVKVHNSMIAARQSNGAQITILQHNTVLTTGNHKLMDIEVDETESAMTIRMLLDESWVQKNKVVSLAFSLL